MSDAGAEKQNTNGPDPLSPFTKGAGPMLAIEGVRVAFLLVILLISLIFQALQPQFLNTEVLFPVYVLLFSAFAINAVYLVKFESFVGRWPAAAFLFICESLLITGLIHVTGVSQSIFLFLYLVNIILCGFVFQRKGALLLALWTSVQFSILLILGPEIRGQSFYFGIGLNNIAFFAVALLSGALSEQLNFMGLTVRRQRRDLRALQNLNSLILENIATGLITTDESGLILLANRAAHEILDLAKTPVGRAIDEVVPELFGRTRELAQNAGRFDHKFIDSDGESATLEVIVSLLSNDPTGGDPSGESRLGGFIFTFQDLTKVRRLESQMRQNEKMAAVGQLAAGIAHEIRNPLASISGSVQLLGSSFTGRQEDEQRLMAIMLREIDRLNNLITEFLDFVKPDQLKDDPVDLNSLLNDIVEMLKLNKNLRPETAQTVDLRATAEIGGHRDKLKQAFLNILINAHQAMNDIEKPAIFISTADVGDRVVVRIRDTGSGIDEKGLKRIFEPFHTTKPKGTGLGLAVTHKIIESHGGKIFVESVRRGPERADGGTEFILEFPARQVRGLDKNALADSHSAAENFQIAFRGQKRSS